jgi:calcium-dependent protein kinase
VVEDQAAGRVAVAMRLCAGGELFEDVVRKQHYGERQAAGAVRALAAYLAAAHAVGVVHRDLKPENILLVAAGSGYDAAGAAAAS